MSMIGNNEMPWSSIPQKKVAFENMEQVGQNGDTSRQSQIPSATLSFYHHPGGIVYNKESFVHKSVVDGAPAYMNSNNSN